LDIHSTPTESQHSLDSMDRKIVVDARVNCKTAFSSNLDHFLRTILHQIEHKFATLLHQYDRCVEEKKTSLKRTMDLKRQSISADGQQNYKNDNTKENLAIESRFRNAAGHNDEDMELEDQNDDMKRLDDWESRVEQKQIGKGSKRIETSEISERLDITADLDNSTSNASSAGVKGLTAVWKFGRSCQKLMREFLKHNNLNQCSIVVVLDHADSLLLSTGKQMKSGSGNTVSSISFLSQLLLLPQTMGLNITTIVITNSILLEHTGRYLNFQHVEKYYPVPSLTNFCHHTKH
jgi:hypothetical protein